MDLQAETVAEAMIEGFNLRQLGHNSPQYLHLLTEAFKLAFADRFPYITDPKTLPGAPIQALLSKEYATLRRGLIKADRAIAGSAPPGDPLARKAILDGHQIRYQTAPATAAAVPAAGPW